MNNKKISAVYNVQDLMQILDIGRNSAYNLMKQNLFPIVRIGKNIRIPKEPFENWLNNISSNNI